MIIDWVLWASFIIGVYATYWLTEYLISPDEEPKVSVDVLGWMLFFGAVGSIPSIACITAYSWLGWQLEKKNFSFLRFFR